MLLITRLVFPILHWEAEAVAGWLPQEGIPRCQPRTGPFLGPPGVPRDPLQLSCHHALLIVSHSLYLPNTSGGEGNGTPLQDSCLENPMDGGAWWAAVHGVAKSPT